MRKLKAKHKKTPNVKVAAIKHGVGNVPIEKRYVDVIGDGAPLFNFMPPNQMPISAAAKRIRLKMGNEQFYPAIAEARRMLDVECPSGVDLTAKPWCGSKVIVALGDGAPGITSRGYFATNNPSGSRWGSNRYWLPDKLLADLASAGIRVNSMCIGHSCWFRMIVCTDFDDPALIEISDACRAYGKRGITLRHKGSDAMKWLATSTGGTYYGQAP